MRANRGSQRGGGPCDSARPRTTGHLVPHTRKNLHRPRGPSGGWTALESFLLTLVSSGSSVRLGGGGGGKSAAAALKLLVWTCFLLKVSNSLLMVLRPGLRQAAGLRKALRPRGKSMIAGATAGRKPGGGGTRGPEYGHGKKRNPSVRSRAAPCRDGGNALSGEQVRNPKYAVY